MAILSDGDKSIKVVSNAKKIHKYQGLDVCTCVCMCTWIRACVQLAKTGLRNNSRSILLLFFFSSYLTYHLKFASLVRDLCPSDTPGARY